jgi:hypothetical protein
MTKVSTSSSSSKKSSSKSKLKPVIPLERPVPKEFNSKNYLTNKCQSVPGDNTSSSYSVTVQYFEEGTPEEWLELLAAHKRVCIGQNITNGPGMYDVLRRHLKGTAVTKYGNVARDTGPQTIQNFKIVVKELTKYFFPQHAVRIQKRYIRRFIRKPKDMKFRAFVNRVLELNGHLDKFPEETTNVTPTILEDDEIKDILHHACPKSWQDQMTTLGFNFPEKTIEDMIEFCERFEQIEDDVIPKKKKSSRKESSSSLSKKTTRKRKTVSLSSSSSSSDNSSEDERFKWCKYHGKCAHTTDECEDIERMCKEDKKRKRRTRFNDRKRDVKRRTKYVKKSEVNALAVKKIKKYLKQKKKAKKTTDELRNFEKLSMSSEEEDASMKSIGSGSLENINDSDLENMSPFTGFKSDDE